MQLHLLENKPEI